MTKLPNSGAFSKKTLSMDVNEHDFIEKHKVAESARKEQRLRALEIAMAEILVEAASVLSSDYSTLRTMKEKLKRIAELSSVMIGAGENTKLVPMVYSLDLVNAVNVLFPKEQSNESIHDSGSSAK